VTMATRPFSRRPLANLNTLRCPSRSQMKSNPSNRSHRGCRQAGLAEGRRPTPSRIGGGVPYGEQVGWRQRFPHNRCWPGALWQWDLVRFRWSFAGCGLSLRHLFWGLGTGPRAGLGLSAFSSESSGSVRLAQDRSLSAHRLHGNECALPVQESREPCGGSPRTAEILQRPKEPPLASGLSGELRPLCRLRESDRAGASPQSLSKTVDFLHEGGETFRILEAADGLKTKSLRLRRRRAGSARQRTGYRKNPSWGPNWVGLLKMLTATPPFLPASFRAVSMSRVCPWFKPPCRPEGRWAFPAPAPRCGNGRVVFQ